MKRGIIFDMDGTLWDSAENVAKSWNVAIRQYGVREKELTTQDIQGVMGKTMDVIADILFAEFPEEKRRLLLKECCQVENDYLREYGGILYDQVPQTLAALKREGYDGPLFLENRYTEPVFGPDALYALRRDAEYVRQAFL